MLVLIFLHRRHLKKQALEDINDPHKSLDFGMGGVTSGMPRRTKPGMPEMTVTDVSGKNSTRKLQGLSMDMNMGSPYLLPANLNGSRESIHSMARSQHDEHDPYRPVTMLRPDNESLRSARRQGEKASLYSASTGQVSSADNAGLIANARPMSQSYPRAIDPASPYNSLTTDEPIATPPSAQRKALPPRKASLGGFDKPLPNLDGGDMEPVPSIPPPEPVARDLPPSRKSSIAAFPPRKQSMHGSTRPDLAINPVPYYEDEAPPMPISKEAPQYHEYDEDPTSTYAGHFSSTLR